MGQIVSDLTSIHWWLTVVVVGIVLNVASAYLKPWIDTQVARFSARRRATIEKEHARRLRIIKKVQADPHEETVQLLREIRSRVNGLSSLMLGLVFFAVGVAALGVRDFERMGILTLTGVSEGLLIVIFLSGVGGMIVGSLALLTAVRELFGANRIQLILFEASKTAQSQKDKENQ
jgi:hypothetical protein